MQWLLDTNGSRREQFLDWVMAAGLMLFGWLQLALVPMFIARPGGFGGPGGSGGLPPADVLISFRAHSPTVLSYLLIALACLPLGLRRHYPLQVLAATVIAAGVYDLSPNPPALVTIAPLIALYTVGVVRDRAVLVRAAIATVGFVVPVSLIGAPVNRLVAEGIRILATFAFAGALGDATRNRRAYIAEVEQRALAAEHGRDEEARRRVEEERLRIARELHDVTAHSLSIIAVQAGAAEHVIDRDADAAKRALRTIRATSKASLDELRSILGVLRGDEDGAPLAPAGSIARLTELAASVENAGVRVELLVEKVHDVPAFAEVSAYRIVQEALTNVVRHANATTATVRIWCSESVLGIEVIDDGTTVVGEVGEGHGIEGMRERVVALGGSFSAGHRPERGFRVAVTIPLSGGAA